MRINQIFLKAIFVITLITGNGNLHTNQYSSNQASDKFTELGFLNQCGMFALVNFCTTLFPDYAIKKNPAEKGKLLFQKLPNHQRLSFVDKTDADLLVILPAFRDFLLHNDMVKLKKYSNPWNIKQYKQLLARKFILDELFIALQGAEDDKISFNSKPQTAHATKEIINSILKEIPEVGFALFETLNASDQGRVILTFFENNRENSFFHLQSNIRCSQLNAFPENTDQKILLLNTLAHINGIEFAIKIACINPINEDLRRLISTAASKEVIAEEIMSFFNQNFSKSPIKTQILDKLCIIDDQAFRDEMTFATGRSLNDNDIVDNFRDIILGTGAANRLITTGDFVEKFRNILRTSRKGCFIFRSSINNHFMCIDLNYDRNPSMIIRDSYHPTKTTEPTDSLTIKIIKAIHYKEQKIKNTH